MIVPKHKKTSTKQGLCSTALAQEGSKRGSKSGPKNACPIEGYFGDRCHQVKMRILEVTSQDVTDKMILAIDNPES